MLKTLWPKARPHILAIAIFLVVSFVYCLPAFKGMEVNQYDMTAVKGMQQQSIEFQEKYGHLPLWTNSLFGGMPAYQVAMGGANFSFSLGYFNTLFQLGLPSPANLFFLSCLLFYFLCSVLGLRTWIAIFGALGYAFSSYNAIIISVGHITKFASMAYAPAVLAGFILLTQRKYIWGFITTLLFTTLLMMQNHIQIVYYTFILLLCMIIKFTIDTIRKKDFTHLYRTGLAALLAGLIGAASFAGFLLPLNEYAKETMRGGRSELTTNKPKEIKSKGGLDRDYAFRWSYGIDETLTFALPAFKGGSSGPTELGEKSKAAENLIEVVQQARIPENYINQLYGVLSAYWGPQTAGTSGPVYFGALVVALFITGLFFIRSWHLYWILASTVITVLMSWGNHFSALNNFLFDYLPYYNKFRTPSMILVIPQLTFCLLASMTLQELLYGTLPKDVLRKKWRRSALAVAGLGLILTAVYFTSDFKGPADKERKEMMTNAFTQLLGQQAGSQLNPNALSASIFDGLQDDRRSLYGKDLFRFWIYLLIGGGLLYAAYANRKISTSVTIGFSILLLIDLMNVDLRYLSSKNYVPSEDRMATYEPTPADLAIKKDTGYYRVFDQSSGDPFNDSRGAYFHNLVNGYHPAKLSLYQDLIENQISKNNMVILNMLNTRYVIDKDPQNGQPTVYTNPEALGPCWLVKNIKYVKNADEEMNSLSNIRPLDTVYVDQREKTKIAFAPEYDSLAVIRFIENRNDLIRYEYNAAKNQFAVLSEIYYPYGWKAFIDGKETPIARVDYCFRGIAIPAGKHSIELRFEPESIKKGNLLSQTTGILSWLLILGGLVIEYRRSDRKTAVAASAPKGKKQA